MTGKRISLRPAADKLPLAIRKNVRDDWEAKKPEFEQNLSDLLGEQWTITTNPNLVYANTEDETYSSRLGSVISWYFEPLVYNMKQFIEKFGDDGKAELNATAARHVIDFGPQDSTDFTYGGLVVENGLLRLVFNAPSCFAVNVDDVSKEIAEALKSANTAANGGKAYNIIARHGVRENYDSIIDEVRQKIGSLVGIPGIKLTPNFEVNAEALSKHKDTRDDWDRILGEATFAYFDGFAYQLKSAGFEDDDLLQDGFQEGVAKNEIALRIVDKLEKDRYNEAVINDGVLNLQTTADQWWVNVDNIGSNILDIL